MLSFVIDNKNIAVLKLIKQNYIKRGYYLLKFLRIYFMKKVEFIKGRVKKRPFGLPPNTQTQ